MLSLAVSHWSICSASGIPLSSAVSHHMCSLVTDVSFRSLSASRVGLSHVRDIQNLVWLHMPRSCSRPGISDRPGICIGWASSGERCYACLHGMPQLLREWWHAGSERCRPRSSSQRKQKSAQAEGGQPTLAEPVECKFRCVVGIGVRLTVVPTGRRP